MRRLLVPVLLAAAAFVPTAPASAYFCAVWVEDICVVPPCGVTNYAYRTVTGGDLLYC